MTPKEAERKLQEVVGPVLEGRGFKRTQRLVYLRRDEERIDRIGFNVFADRSGGIRGTFGAGVRFQAVETWRPGDQGEDAPTVAIPMHFLRADHQYYDWVLSEVTDWAAFGVEVEETLVRRALPFLDRYSSLDALKAALESNDPRDWFTLDPTRRIETLALLHCASGELDRGMALLEKTLGDLADAPVKARFPLVRLRDALRARQDSARA